MAEYVSAGGLPDADADLLAQGRAMRDAIVADLRDITGVPVVLGMTGETDVPGAAVAPGVPGASRLEVCLLEPAPGEPVVLALARAQARFDHVWAVAPETGGALSAWAEVVEPRRWVGCSREAIALASSKSATLARLAAHGLATPLAFQAQAARWVVKPDDGAGAMATRVHGSIAAALDDAAARAGAAVIEPWVDGPALSLSLLCSAHAAELVAINRQSVTVTAQGQVHFGGVQPAAIDLDDPCASALRQLADGVFRALPGLRGYVGVDVVWHAERGPVAIEVNPRLTSAYVGLSARLGRPLGAEILGLFAPAPAPASQRAGSPAGRGVERAMQDAATHEVRHAAG